MLNYYESFCNQLADFEHEISSDREQYVPEVNIETINLNFSSVKKNSLEIIEERESLPTSSEYSPVDRIETEPIKKKRESCSSLFRRSKAERGCKSNTSVFRSSTDSSAIDINDNPNDLKKSSSKMNSEYSSDSYSQKFLPVDLEEGIDESEGD